MRLPALRSALVNRARHPGRGAVLVLLGLAWAVLRLTLDLPYGRFGMGEAFIPLGLLVGSYFIAPAAWQWTGDDRPLASPLRGLLQSLILNSAWLFLMGLGVTALGPPPRPADATPPPPEPRAQGPTQAPPSPVQPALPQPLEPTPRREEAPPAPAEAPTSQPTPAPRPAEPPARPEGAPAPRDAEGPRPAPSGQAPPPWYPPPRFDAGRPPRSDGPPPRREFRAPGPPRREREALVLTEDAPASSSGTWARPLGRRPPPHPLPPGSPELFVFSLGLILATVLGRSLAEGDTAQAREDALMAAANEAKALALQAQMQPHALFNALSGLVELVHEDPQATEDALVALCDYLRRLMAHGRATGGQLSAERELLENYLQMEQIRLGDRLRVQWSWPAWANRLRLPPLLLQPLVENAIVHGISPASEGGDLRIAIAREEGVLHLEVANTGRPPDPGREGTGMGHLRQRLALWHPGACFQMAHDGGWTRVHLLIPEPLPPC